MQPLLLVITDSSKAPRHQQTAKNTPNVFCMSRCKFRNTRGTMSGKLKCHFYFTEENHFAKHVTNLKSLGNSIFKIWNLNSLNKTSFKGHLHSLPCGQSHGVKQLYFFVKLLLNTFSSSSSKLHAVTCAPCDFFFGFTNKIMVKNILP